MPSWPRRPLPFLCAGHSIDHMFMMLYPVVVPLALEREMGLSYGELISLSVGGFVMFGLGAPLAGWLADKWSAVATMTAFFVGIGLSTVLTGFATTPWEIALGLGLIGLFASIYHPVGIAMVVQTAGDRRGRHLGINGVFGSGGMALAAIVAGTLTELYGWRSAFIVPGLVSVAIGVWFQLAFRGGIAVIEPKAKERPTAGLREFVRIMAIIAALTVCSGIVFQALTVGLPKILQHRVGFLDGGIGVGAATTAILILGGASQLVGGWLCDRFPLKGLYLTGYGLMPPVLLLAAGAWDGSMLMLLLLALAIPVGIQPVADSIFARYIPPKWLGTAFGFRFALSLSVSAVAVPILGVLFDRTGDFLVLFIILAGFAAAVVGSVALLPKQPRAERPSPAAAAVPAE